MVLRDPKRLQLLMDYHGLNQRDLAAVAGWASHGHLGALLRGEKKTLRAAPAIRIARRLGVEPDELFFAQTSRVSGRVIKKDKVA